MHGVIAPQARRLPRAQWLSVLLVLVLMAMAAPAALAQEAEAEPLLLGQLATRALANGESVRYAFDAPDEGTYVITTGDEEEAAKFDIILSDDRGETLHDDVFGTFEIELDNGDHFIDVIATEDGVLSLFVTAQLGDMTDDSGRSGDMIAGGFYTEENVDATRYAELRIPRTDYWQRVFVTVSGGEDDVYNAYASGENVYASIGDNTVEGPLTFWSEGGRYDLSVTPSEGGESMTVVTLMSGPLPEVIPGEAVEATFNSGVKDTAWQFEVPEAGRAVTVRLTSDEDIDLDMGVSVNPTVETWTSYASDTNETVSFIAPEAGSYYIRIFTGYPPEDPTPYTLSVEIGEEAPVLTPGVQEWGTLEAGKVQVYSLNIDDANSMVTVQLASASGGEMDLSANLVDEDGYSVASMSSNNSGSVEMIAQAVTTPGIFEVKIDGRYLSDDADYVLIARVESAGDVGAQWASDATASSQYGDSSYAAMQATGEPDVKVAADNPLAWASKEADGPEETLELGYAHAVVPTGARIYESYNPGAVTRVEAQDEDGEWQLLWEGTEPTEEEIRVLDLTFELPDFATNRLRLTISNDLVDGFNEIDAVQLLGAP